MAELLVRVVDQLSADPYKDAQLLKRGDVVVVVPDRWIWGREELRNPDWRILVVPGVSSLQVSAFTGPEFNEDPENPSQVLRPRAFSIDLDSSTLADAFAGWLDDAKRMVPMRRFDLTLEQLMALKIPKEPLEDPNVFA